MNRGYASLLAAKIGYSDFFSASFPFILPCLVDSMSSGVDKVHKDVRETALTIS